MYVTVIDRNIRFHDGTPTLEQMQLDVGGYIETADRFSSGRKSITVDIFCNEEGYLMGLPFTYVNRNNNPIVGNLVVVGSNERTGNSVELTRDELWTVLEAIGFNEYDEVIY